MPGLGFAPRFPGGRSEPCCAPAPVSVLRESTRASGFTLIEILVVLAIVSIMLLAVGLSASSGGASRQLDQEAHRLIALTDLSCDQAELLGQDAGIEFQSGGYRFLRVRGREWEAQASETLRPRVLPKGMVLALEVEDRTVDLEADAGTRVDGSPASGSPRSDKPALRPHLACDSEGNLSANVRLTLQAGNTKVAIAQNPDGALAIVPASNR